MIGHHDEGIQAVSLEFVVSMLQGLHHQFGDFPTAQMHGTDAATIQEPVHGDERVP